MTPFVTDQMDSAGAFVPLETNVQPEKSLPSNSSIFFAGVMADSFVCADRGEVTVANKIASASPNAPTAGNDFMNPECPVAGKLQACRGGNWLDFRLHIRDGRPLSLFEVGFRAKKQRSQK